MTKKKKLSDSDRRFLKFHMPLVNNSLEAAKFHADEHRYENAHLALDGADKHLEKARRETEDEIRKRDEAKRDD